MDQQKGEEPQSAEKEVREIHLKKATIEDIPALISIEKKIADLKVYSAMTDEQEWKNELSKENVTVYLIIDLLQNKD